MKLPKGASYAVPSAVTLAWLCAFGVAWSAGQRHVAALRWLAEAPRATLDAPRSGPAIYAGEVVGPDDRRGPGGVAAAATWWQMTNDDNHDVVCSDRQVRGMRLRAGDRSAPLALFDAAPHVWVPDGRAWEEPDRAVIDVSPNPDPAAYGFPGDAAKCADRERTYSGSWVPGGARAEVLACHDGAALTACAGGPLDGVLAVPTIQAHRAARREEMRGYLRVAAGTLTALLFALGGFLFYVRATVLVPLRSGRGGPVIGWVEVLIAAMLLPWGGLLALSSYRALGPYRRIRSVPTRAVADLAAGPAEVVGTMLAVGGALATVFGVPAIAVRSRISYTYRKEDDGDEYSSLTMLDRTDVARVEVSDATGTCALALDHVMLLGHSAKGTFAAKEFAASFPDLWKAIATTLQVQEVTLEQTYVPDGAQGFVSGEAVPDDEQPAPGTGYRDGGKRWRLRGREGRSLIVSAWSEAEVSRYVRRPSVLLGWAAALCWATAVALLVLVGAIPR